MLIPDTDPDVVESMIVATVSACADMSRTKTGALIVFERKERLGEIIATGTRVDAAPSAELIKNIFFKNSPLHDGAMIVRAGRGCAAGCVLPLSGNQGLSRDLGTRHRAAVGMSETADSVLVVVSEETGAISVAIGGMLKRHLSPEILQKMLESELLGDELRSKNDKAVLPPSATSGREAPASEEEFSEKAGFSAERSCHWRCLSFCGQLLWMLTIRSATCALTMSGAHHRCIPAESSDRSGTHRGRGHNGHRQSARSEQERRRGPRQPDHRNGGYLGSDRGE